MEYIIGAGVMLAIISFFHFKKKADDHNKLTLLPYSEWMEIYISADYPQRHGMARAVIHQGYDFAAQIGVVTRDECNKLQLRAHKYNPIDMMDDTFSRHLPVVAYHIEKHEIFSNQARVVAALVFGCTLRADPDEGLKYFISNIRPLH